MIKKLKSFLVFPLILMLGLAFGYFVNVSNTNASGGCAYSYCSGGECVSSINATSCASPNGELPCTGHLNCAEDPVRLR